MKDQWRSARSISRLKKGNAWPRIVAAVKALPRVRIVSEKENALRAESRSRLFGFVDDLRVEVIDDEMRMHSVARRGLFDFGVNARRLAQLRASLADVIA